jgi:hypothetical protein
MKEFKAHMHPDNLSSKANPLLVSKIDIEVNIKPLIQLFRA